MIRLSFTLLASLALFCTLGGCSSPKMAGAAAPPPLGSGDYTIDGPHSSIVYKINHLGVSNFYGRFNQISGQYSVDPEELGRCSVFVEIDAASVDSNSEGRDAHLNGPDFFDVENHPTIRFEGTGLAPATDAGYTMTGDLTILGVTRPATARVRWVGEGETVFGYRSGFEAMVTVRRTDFGMDKYVTEGVLGNDVEVIVSIEGVPQEATAAR